ncbi:Sec23/Sec24 protein transport family protein [Actinidia rufa]|uniref:Sec23/Sec24 protein transport family protein n=1 Tax=Actinidia rufa TaxID=165716 RepID=A0A7J0H9U1_9ERIC|nr:Sec23/Sec24 protein transport family protein [Actinidia rufa]
MAKGSGLVSKVVWSYSSHCNLEYLDGLTDSHQNHLLWCQLVVPSQQDYSWKHNHWKEIKFYRKNMGTKNPTHGSFPQRPAVPPFATSQSTTPFSFGPVVESQASAFRSTPPTASQTSRPFLSSGLVVGSVAFGSIPTQTAQAALARTSAPGQPVFSPPIRPPAGLVRSPPVSLHLQPQIPSVPMGSPPQSINHVPLGMTVPPSYVDASFYIPRPTLQPSQSAFPGYPSKPSNAVTQPPPVQSAPSVAHQGGYGLLPPATSATFCAHQGGYGPPPPVAAPLGIYSREQMPLQGSGPPMRAVQALPRPLIGDVEPKSFAEMYPMNCNSRYLRFTTCAIPNSQSLVSRWHLSLGAVVCPLAEAPDGIDMQRQPPIPLPGNLLYPYQSFVDPFMGVHSSRRFNVT